MCMSNKDVFFTEEEFYEFLDLFFPENRGLILGRGDDCAIIAPPQKLLVSSDIFLEGVHFHMKYFPPFFIGYKSLAVNISDILGMGGVPVGFNLNLMIKREVVTRKFFTPFFKGMSKLCRRFSMCLFGGDISFANKFGVVITIFGKADRYIPRKGAKTGDKIFVTGDIGLSRAGLYALEKGIYGFKESKKVHLMGNISYPESIFIAKNRYVSSLMDVSDGVFKDILRLVPKGCGADLRVAEDVIHPEVKEMANMLGEDAVHFALKGGEDYVLMGTCRGDGIFRLKKEIPHLKVIGEVISEEEFLINGKKIGKGFDHFSKGSSD